MSRGLSQNTNLIVIHDGPDTPQFNMEKDIDLFQNVETHNDTAYLRFYSWNFICATYGSNQKIADIKKIIHAMKDIPPDIALVRRPTGGGIVIHYPQLITYSLVISDSALKQSMTLLDSYYQLSELINNCLLSMGIQSSLNKTSMSDYKEKRINPVCVDYPAKYEIMKDNQKIVGCAQKKGRNCLLQQTQFFIEIDNDVFKNKFEDAISNYLNR
ncbi:MAG: hypothetical protein A2Y40_05490 [Candidatus Margulisbacteria bacterium GWF2_35_9]|nr:MAG: hypothetical protein A2Y40_05490 [Candidatus Margulisbacteria bacterium GWF2_35_9]